ncbi:MAG: hypothetical protein E7Z72_01205 [Methanocorpusculum parvum]|nr:hypothetical protein [Methanocorpusculum parvum]
MKKGVVILIICLALVCIGIFAFEYSSSICSGEEGLIDKARDEIPIADADTIELVIAGKSVDGDAELYWFKSGNEYQYHRYTPIEFTAFGDDRYRFVKTYNPIDRGMQMYALQWNGGYAFMIDNEKCAALKLTYPEVNPVVEIIPVDSVPFVYYSKLMPAEYTFLDAEGNPGY